MVIQCRPLAYSNWLTHCATRYPCRPLIIRSCLICCSGSRLIFAPAELDFHDARQNAVCWYKLDEDKPEATEALEYTQKLVALLEQQGWMIGVKRTLNPGLIVYEDEIQVAALNCGSWRRLGYRAKDALISIGRGMSGLWESGFDWCCRLALGNK